MKRNAPRRGPSRPKVPPPAAAPAKRPQPRPRRIAVTVAAALLMAGSTAPLSAGDIEWRRDYATAYHEAGRDNKPMLIHVSAHWCGPCHRMLNETYTDANLVAALGGPFVPLMLDADADAEWLERLGVEAVPTVLVIDSQKRIVRCLSGFQSAAQLETAIAVARPPAPVDSNIAAVRSSAGMSMFQAMRSMP